jgi:hypothetical protein
MQILVTLGTVVSVIGLAGLVYCIVAIFRARRAGLSDDALRGRLARLVPLNLGALLLSFIGLGMILVGALLG